MITEDYVSFETAKLLKEKGFNDSTDKQFNSDKIVGDYNITDRARHPEKYLDAPTLQMARKWLRKEHKLHIEVVLNQDVQDEEAVIANHYHFNVSRLDRFANEGGDCKFYNSYEEACEAAIKYCLENLI